MLAGDPAHVHIIPAEKIIIVYTGADVVTFDPRPTVTKWQLVQACADAGITEAQLIPLWRYSPTNGSASGAWPTVSTGTTHFASVLRTHRSPFQPHQPGMPSSWLLPHSIR